nr:phospholipase A2 group XV isoform X2 [Hydra vulgaris]
MASMPKILKRILLLICIDNTLSLAPIVIVPGIGGSQIEAKLNRDQSTYYWCYKQYPNWFTLWLSIEELFPIVEKCLAENIKTNYNDTTKTMENAKGVYTRVPDFGNTTAIEWLDPYIHFAGVYFFPFIDALTRSAGYVRGKSLRAAPYDFRYDPSVFGGSVKAVLAYISGDSFGIPYFLDSPIKLREFQRSFSSLSYILPNSNFWNDNEVIVKTNDRSYTVKDYDTLFEDINYPIAQKILKLVPEVWSNEPPGVKMYCFYGNLVETPEVLYYKSGFAKDNYPNIYYGDGDGTVNLKSLEGCRLWQGKQKQQIIHRMFPMGEHNGILQNPYLIRSVIEALEQ